MVDLKIVVRWLTAAAAAVVVIPVVGEWSVEFAREQGFYANPSRQVDAVIGLVGRLTAAQWFPWLGGVILGLAAGVWLDALLRRLGQKPPRPPIEIRFDPANPGGRFWSEETWEIGPDSIISGLEHRFEICNNTDSALIGVFVTIEEDNGIPKRLKFKRGDRETCDIAPGHFELVKGFLMQECTGPSGVVTITAGAQNASPVERRFRFDPRREPWLTSL